MEGIFAAVLGWLVDLSLRGGLLLGLIYPTVIGLKRATPALRSALLALGFCGILTLPLLTPFAPFRFDPPMTEAFAEAAGIAAYEPGEDRASFAPGPVEAPAMEIPAAGGFKPGWPGLCLLGWGAGCLAGLIRLGTGLYGVRRLKRTGMPPHGLEIQTLAVRAGAAVGLKSPVPLIMSSSLKTPVAAGAVRPCVILPRQATAWQRASPHRAPA